MIEKSEKSFRERNNEAVRKHNSEKDMISIRFDKGLFDRIRALGYTPTGFIKEATINALEKAEKAKKREEKNQ